MTKRFFVGYILLKLKKILNCDKKIKKSWNFNQWFSFIRRCYKAKTVKKKDFSEEYIFNEVISVEKYSYPLSIVI